MRDTTKTTLIAFAFAAGASAVQAQLPANDEFGGPGVSADSSSVSTSTSSTTTDPGPAIDTCAAGSDFSQPPIRSQGAFAGISVQAPEGLLASTNAPRAEYVTENIQLPAGENAVSSLRVWGQFQYSDALGPGSAAGLRDCRAVMGPTATVDVVFYGEAFQQVPNTVGSFPPDLPVYAQYSGLEATIVDPNFFFYSPSQSIPPSGSLSGLETIDAYILDVALPMPTVVPETAYVAITVTEDNPIPPGPGVSPNYNCRWFWLAAREGLDGGLIQDPNDPNDLPGLNGDNGFPYSSGLTDWDVDLSLCLESTNAFTCDLNADGSVDYFDVIVMIRGVANGFLSYDIAGPGGSGADGTVDVFDIQEFVSLVNNGGC